MTLLDVPLIDLSGFRDGDEATRRRIADEVGRACRDIGFLVITGHGVAPEKIKTAYETSLEFFSQDVSAKAVAGRPDPSHIRGYIGRGVESLAQLDNMAAPPDIKELFDVGPSDVPADAYHEAGGATFAPNVWPETPGAMKPVLTDMFDTMTGTAQMLSQVFAMALDLEPDYFLPKIDKHTSIMRVNYYPAQEEPPLPGQMRVGQHTDYTAFTVLWQEAVDSGGLQVLNKAGEWVDVPVIPDSLVVNIGDSLARWTNDTWVSTMHRVVNPEHTVVPTNTRISIVMFFQPNYDAVIECIPTCQGPDRPAKYAPIKNGEYLAAKFAQQQIDEEEIA
ncbi:2-oxoglutarate and iron-dependent oxygenase domain-containing protein [Amycolatopsis sp. NPDC049253]|uniref:isopenicillin N synthase family dioxygenase n=1 Tax=Amycolatopsis sp. NPDC049253 TaxID=3155274 RepID=UPI003444495C